MTELTNVTRQRVLGELERVGAPGFAVAWIHGASGAPQTLVHGVADATAAAAGHAHAIGPHTRFALFSGTKLYTAAAVMRLVEQGSLSLDAPVREYLDELAVADELTVRHLLSHASGLSDTLTAFLSVHFAGERAPSTAEALARYRLGLTRPGRGARYTNVSFAILGELISRVAGMPFVDFVRRELLAPLGAELSFEAPVEGASDGASDRASAGASAGASAATGHVSRLSPMLYLLRWLIPHAAQRIRAGRAGRLVTLRPYALDTAAIGGLSGSALAFLPLLREMLSETDGVLRAASKREMLTLQSRGAAGVVSRDGVGLGWKRGTVDGRIFWNHEGGGAGFGTETRLYPDVGLGVVILMNLSHSAGLSRACHRACELLWAAHRG